MHAFHTDIVDATLLDPQSLSCHLCHLVRASLTTLTTPIARARTKTAMRPSHNAPYSLNNGTRRERARWSEGGREEESAIHQAILVGDASPDTACLFLPCPLLVRSRDQHRRWRPSSSTRFLYLACRSPLQTPFQPIFWQLEPPSEKTLTANLLPASLATHLTGVPLPLAHAIDGICKSSPRWSSQVQHYCQNFEELSSRLAPPSAMA